MKKIKLEPAIISNSKLSADNFKKILDLDGSTPEPALRSGDTGQWVLCFDSCQLITTLDVQYVCNISLPVLPNWLESVRLNIGYPVVRTDGRAVYGHVITKFSGMGRFTYPWCSAGALRAPELRYYFCPNFFLFFLFFFLFGSLFFFLVFKIFSLIFRNRSTNLVIFW